MRKLAVHCTQRKVQRKEQRSQLTIFILFIILNYYVIYISTTHYIGGKSLPVVVGYYTAKTGKFELLSLFSFILSYLHLIFNIYFCTYSENFFFF